MDMTTRDQVRVFDSVRGILRTGECSACPLGVDAEFHVERLNEALASLEQDAWRRGVAFGKETATSHLTETDKRQAFDDGFTLGSSVVQRQEQDRAVQNLLLAFGKDRADGPIDLGSFGTRFVE